MLATCVCLRTCVCTWMCSHTLSTTLPTREQHHVVSLASKVCWSTQNVKVEMAWVICTGGEVVAFLCEVLHNTVGVKTGSVWFRKTTDVWLIFSKALAHLPALMARLRETKQLQPVSFWGAGHWSKDVPYSVSFTLLLGVSAELHSATATESIPSCSCTYCVQQAREHTG